MAKAQQDKTDAERIREEAIESFTKTEATRRSAEFEEASYKNETHQAFEKFRKATSVQATADELQRKSYLAEAEAKNDQAADRRSKEDMEKQSKSLQKQKARV